MTRKRWQTQLVTEREGILIQITLKKKKAK